MHERRGALAGCDRNVTVTKGCRIMIVTWAVYVTLPGSPSNTLQALIDGLVSGQEGALSFIIVPTAQREGELGLCAAHL